MKATAAGLALLSLFAVSYCESQDSVSLNDTTRIKNYSNCRVLESAKASGPILGQKVADSCTASIVITSVPPVADIYVGDVHAGRTNVNKICIGTGVQIFTFKKNDKTATAEILCVAGENAPLHVVFQRE
ncbi:MAG: hypothetical protein GF331_16860 [Chitinivibrionales bacterium]|nr:hypothetical protein [Chitinivibrionales bacterium]